VLTHAHRRRKAQRRWWEKIEPHKSQALERDAIRRAVQRARIGALQCGGREGGGIHALEVPDGAWRGHANERRVDAAVKGRKQLAARTELAVRRRTAAEADKCAVGSARAVLLARLERSGHVSRGRSMSTDWLAVLLVRSSRQCEDDAALATTVRGVWERYERHDRQRR
jgi:hypothetical protein